jgi:chorismate mutase
MNKKLLFITIFLMGMFFNKAKAQEPPGKDTMSYYRGQIDTLDKQIIHLLGERMGAARAIGTYKLDHHMGVVQSARFDEVLLNAIKQGKSEQLSEEFIRALYNDIHKESINQQEILQQTYKKGKP